MTSIFPPFNRRTSFRKQPYFFEAGRGVNSKGLAGPIPALSLTFTSGALYPRITFSRPSLATYFDSTGKLTYAPNNLLVNTATLSTQTVNTNIVAGFDVILSFTGTGSVAISGGHTATLAGTGATNRVFLKFTPTTTSLTFTVTGTVTEAMLERVTYQTTPSTYVANTVSPSSPYFGPRFEYDPVTLVPRGLLIEEAMAANLVLYSQDFRDTATVGSSRPWVWSNLTAALTTATNSPDGTQNAYKLAESTTSSVAHSVAQSISVTSGAAYTFTVFAKMAERSFVALQPFGGAVFAYFNLSTGVVGTTGGSPTATSIQPVGNGWYRCSITANAPFGGPVNVFVYPAATDGNATYAGAIGSGVYLWGAQYEARSFATSYLPTGASTAARSADDVSMTGTNFSSWYSQAQGTFICTHDYLAGSATSANGRVAMSAWQASNTRIMIYNGGGAPTGYCVISGADQAYLQRTAVAANVMTKLAFACAPNDFAAVQDGGAVATDTSGSLPTPTAFYIGSQTNSAHLNGHIASIQYFGVRLSDTQLQRLTA